MTACDAPDPARAQAMACHRQLLKSELHRPGDIIEVM
jgi:hypothetical protein